MKLLIRILEWASTPLSLTNNFSISKKGEHNFFSTRFNWGALNDLIKTMRFRVFARNQANLI